MEAKVAPCPKCGGKKLLTYYLFGTTSVKECPVCLAAGVIPHARRDKAGEERRLAELEKKVNAAQLRLF